MTLQFPRNAGGKPTKDSPHVHSILHKWPKILLYESENNFFYVETYHYASSLILVLQVIKIKITKGYKLIFLK